MCLRLLQHTIDGCLGAPAHEMLEVNTSGFKGLLLVKFKISKSRDKYTMGQKNQSMRLSGRINCFRSCE